MLVELASYRSEHRDVVREDVVEGEMRYTGDCVRNIAAHDQRGDRERDLWPRRDGRG